MKPIKRIIYIFLAIVYVSPVVAQDKIAFWDTQQYGANSFNASPPDVAYFKALKKTGATWVRLTFSKWRGQTRDFLIGNMDDYQGLVEQDFQILKSVLDSAHTAGIKVALVPLSLPGSRWIQHNKRVFDDRLWSHTKYVTQSAQFWQDLAKRLHNHPAIIAYNVINEPVPERKGGGVENASVAHTMAWHRKHKNTPRDLQWVYTQIIKAIRTVDTHTPIMVESGWYANPISYASWDSALPDDKVIYGFHMYEPYKATSTPNRKRKKQGRPVLRYPGVKTEYMGHHVQWNKAIIAQHIKHAFTWAKHHNIPYNRMVMSEFGCIRDWVDCGAYLNDVLDSVNAYKAHWAWYTFRPDEWDAMDYELPTDFPMGHYYWFIEDGRYHKLPRNGKLIKIIQSKMQ